MKKVVIAGGTGFMGRALYKWLEGEGWDIVVLTRKVHPDIVYRQILWDAKTIGAWTQELNGADALINLCGRTVDCRYNKKNRTQIYASRLQSTSVLGLALKTCPSGPKVWLNAASATIYRHAEDRPQTEENGEHGTGFSVDVCEQWEKAFFSSKTTGIRKVALRTAIVLGDKGGVMGPFKRLVNMGLGGSMGNGRQMFSWVHEDDFCAAVTFILANDNLEGPVNIAAPEPVTNMHWMAALRIRLGKSYGMPLPKWVLEIGSVIIQTETELILKSRWVLPAKLQNAGFVFSYPTVVSALDSLEVS
jgi:uncharacterized protein